MPIPISGLPALTTPQNGDLLAIVNTSGAITSRITRQNLLAGTQLPANTVNTQAIADASITAPKINFGGSGSGVWWEEIGRSTLTTSSSTISIPTIAARKYLKLMITLIPTGGTIDHGLRFNNDSAANYNFRRSINGGSDLIGTGAYFYLDTGITAAAPIFVEAVINNFSGIEKYGFGLVSGGSANGVGNVSQKVEYANKWASNAQITRIDAFNTSGTGSFAAGSEVIVLGHN